MSEKQDGGVFYDPPRMSLLPLAAVVGAQLQVVNQRLAEIERRLGMETEKRDER